MPKRAPKHNPKLDRPKDKKEERSKVVEDKYEYQRNYTALYMILVFFGIVIGIVLLFVFVFNAPGTRIEKYDKVKLDYKIYTLEQYDDHEAPEIKKDGKWLNCCSRYDDECDNGLIEGFYKELLGKKVGDICDNKLFEACKDNDEDGEDDGTGEDALSYGFPDDDLYDTDIVLWFKVLEIKKKGSTNAEVGIPWDSVNKQEPNSKVLEIFKYTIFFNEKLVNSNQPKILYHCANGIQQLNFKEIV